MNAWPPYDRPEPQWDEPNEPCPECGGDGPCPRDCPTMLDEPCTECGSEGPCPPSCPLMREPEDVDPFDDYCDDDAPLSPARRNP